MSRTSKVFSDKSISKGISAGIFGLFAASLTLGAVQLASGRDLAEIVRGSSGTTAASVNRAAKTDRAVAAATGPARQTRTILLRLDSLSDTSILIRLPVAVVARNGQSARSLLNSGDRKATVACEPIVSVLTEVSKRLEPGRCIT
jgi:hypothetical protein